MENRYEIIIFWSDDDDAFVPRTFGSGQEWRGGRER